MCPTQLFDELWPHLPLSEAERQVLLSALDLSESGPTELGSDAERELFHALQ